MNITKSKNNLTRKDKLTIEVLGYLKEKTNTYINNLSNPASSIINWIFGN